MRARAGRLTGRPRGSRIAALATVLLLAAFVVAFWTEPLAAFRAVERLAPGIVWRVETGEPLVALSFDDGPDPAHTPQVLDILARHRAQATFFLIGSRAARHPDLVARIKAAGHEVGNHCFTDGTSMRASSAEFLESLRRTEQAAGIHDTPKLFRPPGGLAWPRHLRLAREQGYLVVLGSAYPHDPSHPPVAYIEWLVEKNLVPGAIVILHDGIADPSRTLEALPRILAAGKDRGLGFVSVGVLLGEGTPPLAHAGR